MTVWCVERQQDAEDFRGAFSLDGQVGKRLLQNLNESQSAADFELILLLTQPRAGGVQNRAANNQCSKGEVFKQPTQQLWRSCTDADLVVGSYARSMAAYATLSVHNPREVGPIKGLKRSYIVGGVKRPQMAIVRPPIQGIDAILYDSSPSPKVSGVSLTVFGNCHLPRLYHTPEVRNNNDTAEIRNRQRAHGLLFNLQES